MVREAVKAAENLEKEGISVEVIDLRTVSPLDLDTILTPVKTGHGCCSRSTASAGRWLPPLLSFTDVYLLTNVIFTSEAAHEKRARLAVP